MSERARASAALPADADAFGRLFEEHRRDIVVLCYRFLGSLHDAEDAAQETALRAWRGRSTFRGEAGVRTWLHRIATRVCLDALGKRQRRSMPPDVRPAAQPAAPPESPASEITWLEPLPDTFLVDASADPAARYSLRESVSLAFIAALQALPARQRAVLLLRDVLAWRATEAADVLGMTVSAANSALNRARSTLQASVHGGDLGGMLAVGPPDPAEQRLLEAYMRAWAADDVDALVATLRDEVRLAMPPSPSWYSGLSAVVEFLRRWVLPMGPFRLRPTGANLQPAVALSVERDDRQQPLGIHVLTLRDGRIALIDAFMDPRIAARFIGEEL